MRDRAILTYTTVIGILLITLCFLTNLFLQHKNYPRPVICLTHANRFHENITVETTTPTTKCSLSKTCPPDHFAFSIRSGASDVVGPRICFDGKIIMSHVLNNVGPGLNIVVVNGENGVIEKYGFLNLAAGNPEQILAYLKDIKPGMIVLVASFDDAAVKLTNEMRETFVGMGSTLIGSVKHRDNWVFAGRVGTKIKSFFEKQVVNDQKTNMFDGWPEMAEVGGCFPRTVND